MTPRWRIAPLLLVPLVLIGCLGPRRPLSPLVPTPIASPDEPPPIVAEASPLPLPQVHATRLDTGLTLWTAPLTTEVVTACFVTRRLGSDVPVAFADHPELLLEIIADREPRIAESKSSGVGGDAVRLCIDGLPDELPEVVEALAAVVLEPRYDPAAVERARDARAAARDRERYSTATGRQLVTRWLSPAASALGAGTGDVGDALHRFDADWTRVLHDHAFAASDGLLVITGAVDPAAAAALVEASFGGWRPAREPLPPSGGPTAVPSDLDAVFVPCRLAQAVLFAGFSGPARSEPDHVAFEVLLALTASGPSSRLFRALREPTGASYGVQLQHLHRRGGSVVVLMTGVDAKVSAESTRRLMKELARLRSELVAPAELDAAVGRVREGMRGDLTRTGPLAERLADLFAAHRSIDDLADLDRRLAAVDAQALQAVAQRYLRRPTPVVVLAAPPVAKDLERAGLRVVREGPDDRRPR